MHMNGGGSEQHPGKSKKHCVNLHVKMVCHEVFFAFNY